MSELHIGEKIKIVKRTIIAVCVVAVVLVGFYAVAAASKVEEPEIITTSTLKKIINVSDLSTFEAVYNGVSKVMNENNPEDVDYYVSYEAKVKAGFDFEQVDIDVNNEEKIIKVNLPEIKITETNVDIASLDYIFENNKANTSTVSEQAYKQCIEDVKAESSKENAIYEIAEQNAKNMIKALIDPFVQQLDAEYKLVVE